jgi:hypothetical protein
MAGYTPIVLGASPNDGTGEGLRNGGVKLNAMLQELYGISLTDAPSDSHAYGRLNGSWVQVLPLTGGTMTGPISAPGATITGPISAPYLTGGDFGVGTLRTINNHTICFDWANTGTGYQLAFHIDGVTTGAPYVCTTLNAQNLKLQSGGGPIGVQLNLSDFGGNAYAIFTDTASDERIKTNMQPTAVDALAQVLQVEVSQFDIIAAAASALQPYDSPAIAQDVHVPIGLIAQQVQSIMPEMVTVVQQAEGHDPAIPDDMHYITLQQAVPYLIRAIQQLEARLAALEGAGP